MGRLAAIEIAFSLIAQPALIRCVADMPLPSGVTTLLEIAAGDPQANHNVALVYRRPQPHLAEACGFFIEQVLLAERADSYRILGCRGDEPHHHLRRHMALLLRWLHPDRVILPAHGFRIDRTVFAHRVTKAWEDLKTVDRRAAFDQRCMERLALGAGFRTKRTRSAARPPFRFVVGPRRSIQPFKIAPAEAEFIYAALFDFLRNDA